MNFSNHHYYALPENMQPETILVLSVYVLKIFAFILVNNIISPFIDLKTRKYTEKT